MLHPAALEISNVVKTFHTETTAIPVLNGLSLTVAHGAFDAVMGASGSGKSTLLHLAAGLLSADSGTIHINGKNICAMNDNAMSRFRRAHIGLIFQDFNLIPTLTAEENIALPCALDGRSPNPERMNALLEQLNLQDRRAHLPAALSGGERQRVAIARALITDPCIILADEPTGNLDAPASRAFCELLAAMNASTACAILLVTHDPVVATTANRVHIMRDGMIAETLDTAHDPATLSAHYLAIYSASR